MNFSFLLNLTAHASLACGCVLKDQMSLNPNRDLRRELFSGAPKGWPIALHVWTKAVWFWQDNALETRQRRQADKQSTSVPHLRITVANQHSKPTSSIEIERRTVSRQRGKHIKPDNNHNIKPLCRQHSTPQCPRAGHPSAVPP